MLPPPGSDRCARTRGPLARGCRRWSALAVALALMTVALVPAAALADTSSDQAQLQQTQAALTAIKAKLATARGQAAVIQTQVNALSSQIATLNKQVGVDTQSVYNLESNISTDDAQIAQLQSQYNGAQQQADARARTIYMAGPASTLTSLLTSNSISQFIQKTQIWEIASELDSSVIIQSSRLKNQLQTSDNALSASKATLQAKEGDLAGRADLLNQAQKAQATALAEVQTTIAQEEKNEQELMASSEALTAALQANPAVSHSTAGGAVSASGLIWPVNGPITSPFGPRPSMHDYHYGIDIGASTGTPIHAAKAGTVLAMSCGTGYGLCVIIDHGGGLSTLYAHQSRIGVTGGEHVAQGQVIGYVGCTGYCTGPHLHFEVRLNGTPHNPVNYLPAR